MIVQTLNSMLKNITKCKDFMYQLWLKQELWPYFRVKLLHSFALFSEKFTRLTRILHDRRSHRSRQISTLQGVAFGTLGDVSFRLLEASWETLYGSSGSFWNYWPIMEIIWVLNWRLRWPFVTLLDFGNLLGPSFTWATVRLGGRARSNHKVAPLPTFDGPCNRW